MLKDVFLISKAKDVSKLKKEKILNKKNHIQTVYHKIESDPADFEKTQNDPKIIDKIKVGYFEEKELNEMSYDDIRTELKKFLINFDIDKTYFGRDCETPVLDTEIAEASKKKQIKNKAEWFRIVLNRLVSLQMQYKGVKTFSLSLLKSKEGESAIAYVQGSSMVLKEKHFNLNTKINKRDRRIIEAGFQPQTEGTLLESIDHEFCHLLQHTYVGQSGFKMQNPVKGEHLKDCVCGYAKKNYAEMGATAFNVIKAKEKGILGECLKKSNFKFTEESYYQRALNSLAHFGFLQKLEENRINKDII